MRRLLIAGLLMLATGDVRAETLRLYAAGSLKAVLTDVVQAFEADHAGALKVAPGLSPAPRAISDLTEPRGWFPDRIRLPEFSEAGASDDAPVSDSGRDQRLSSAKMSRL